jgi:hypothetical protein
LNSELQFAREALSTDWVTHPQSFML